MNEFLSEIYWRFHPNRRGIDLEEAEDGYLVGFDEYEFLVKDWETVLSFTVPRPFEKYIDLEEDYTCLDVGATYGEDSVVMADKTERVISLEPDKENFDVLKRNVSHNDLRNIDVRNLGAWSENGKIKFYRSDKPTDGGMFENHLDGRDVSEIIEVDVVRIDDLVDSVDFMKMNIEGGEIEALEGAEKTLEKCEKVFITTDHFVENEYTTRRVVHILEDHGFDARWVEPKDKRYIAGDK